MLPLLSLVTAVPLVATLPASADGPAVVMDGTFEDWTADAVVLTDPVDAPNGPVDIQDISVRHDADHVYFRINLTRTVNVQGLDGCLSIILDADGDTETGREAFGVPGAEIAIQFTPPHNKRNNRAGRGVGVQAAGYVPRNNDANARHLSGYDVGLVFAPTHATKEVEIRIERGIELPRTAPLFKGDHFIAKLHMQGAGGVLVDETESFRVDLTPTSPIVITQEQDPLATTADALRVISWNGERGALFSKSEIFARVFRALQPDVVLLQELTDKHSARQVAGFFNGQIKHPDGKEWHVSFGTAGGNLRTAIVSRYPIIKVPELDQVRYPSAPERTVRVVGAIVETGRGDVLVASTHLKCCGRINSREDDKRLVEASLVNEVIQEVSRRYGANNIVIGGDLNLVGSKTPLTRMIDSLDADGSALGVSNPMHLDGAANTTWADRGTPFAPGRLDYIVYSDATMQSVNGFVLDTQDLAEHWREEYRLQLLDTERASDHLPVVVDLAITRR
ncbi:MAG: endonuclease/exonuclease/phosphatase family protein [Planctomycetota bacterium]